MSFPEATKDEAVAAVLAQSFTDGDGRRTVHSFNLGGSLMLGADWDTDDVVETIRNAQELRWFDDFVGHDLAVKTADGRFYKFEVKRNG